MHGLETDVRQETVVFRLAINALWGEKLGKEWSDLTPTELDLTFWVPDCGAKFRQNSWARTRWAQLSAGYTVNTYSKPPLYDA